MEIKVQTQKYDVIDSGCVFLEDEYLEFLIEGLVFRLYINTGKEEGDDRTTPYVNYRTENSNGINFMAIRAFNWGGPNTITLTKPIHLASVNGKKLLFRFSSSETKDKDEKKNFTIHYSWVTEKSAG